MNQLVPPLNGEENIDLSFDSENDDFDFQMANLAFDQSHDNNVHNHFSKPPIDTSNHIFPDRNVASSSSSNGNDIRMSMPAPKRTLPTNIVDSLNEDSLFYSAGHQHHIFSGGVGNSYLNTETSGPNSESTVFANRKEDSEIGFDSSFDSSRGPRSFSLGDDVYPLNPTLDHMYSRPASTPINNSYSPPSLNGSQFHQNGSHIGNHNGTSFGQRQIENFNSTLQRFQQHDQEGTPHSRTMHQQQQHGYIQPQSTPSNLQIHLADIDRRMQIRRGKSTGLNLNSYDSGPMQPHLKESMSAQGATRQSHQQHPFLTGRNGLPIPTFRSPETTLHHPSTLQRPASTPLPMNPVHHMHHVHQQPSSSDHMHKPHGAPLLNLCELEDSSVEDIVAKSCRGRNVEPRKIIMNSNAKFHSLIFIH